MNAAERIKEGSAVYIPPLPQILQMNILLHDSAKQILSVCIYGSFKRSVLWGRLPSLEEPCCWVIAPLTGSVGGLLSLLYCGAAALLLPSLMTRFRVMVACSFINWKRQCQLTAYLVVNMFASLPDSFWKIKKMHMIMCALFSAFGGQMHLLYWLIGCASLDCLGL